MGRCLRSGRALPADLGLASQLAAQGNMPLYDRARLRSRSRLPSGTSSWPVQVPLRKRDLLSSRIAHGDLGQSATILFRLCGLLNPSFQLAEDRVAGDEDERESLRDEASLRPLGGSDTGPL